MQRGARGAHMRLGVGSGGEVDQIPTPNLTSLWPRSVSTDCPQRCRHVVIQSGAVRRHGHTTHEGTLRHVTTPVPDGIAQHLLARGAGASAEELRGWGLSDWDIRRLVRDGSLTRSRRGRYVLPLSPELTDRWARARTSHLRRLASLADSDAVACRRTAALVWGLPVSSIPPLPEIIRPPGSHRPGGSRTLLTDMTSADIRWRNGVPFTSLERTVVDVALDLPTPLALVTADAALRRGADGSQMLAMLSERGAVRGCREARRTLAWADGHAESPLESRGRGELMLRGVPRPQCNVVLRLGDVEFRVDTLWVHEGIVGEADGKPKYDREGRQVEPLWAERLRQGWLEDELGLLVVRWIDAEVRLAPEGLARRWRRLEGRRGGQLWVPPAGLEISQRVLPALGDQPR